QVLAKPGTIKPHKKFKAEVYVLTKEEGGRHTPYFNGYRPQFYFRTTDVTGVCTLPQGVEMVMPGDNVTMAIELIVPIAMEKELRFAIREGGRTVGAGVVTEISEEGLGDIISLACRTCQRRNYSTTKNRRTHPDRLELKKYCRWCRKHTAHRETKYPPGYRRGEWKSQPIESRRARGP